MAPLFEWSFLRLELRRFLIQSRFRILFCEAHDAIDGHPADACPTDCFLPVGMVPFLRDHLPMPAQNRVRLEQRANFFQPLAARHFVFDWQESALRSRPDVQQSESRNTWLRIASRSAQIVPFSHSAPAAAEAANSKIHTVEDSPDASRACDSSINYGICRRFLTKEFVIC